MTSPTPAEEDFAGLNQLLVEALLALAGAAAGEQACRLAARCWSLLRHRHAREAERLTAVLHALTRSGNPTQEQGDAVMGDIAVLDVRALVPAQRHRQIFATYEALSPGGKFVLVNDHDPKPLYYQFEAEHHGGFSWRYLEEGPAVWRVEIGRTEARI